MPKIKMMDKNSKKNKLILYFVPLFCFLIFGSCIFNKAAAAEINIIPLNWEVGVNHNLEVNISFSTEKESINAISGEVKFPQEILELKEIKDGNSIISLWVEKPKKEGDKIVFAGIIPGGFNGDNGLIFSLVFKTKKEGNGIIELQNMESFYNDGKGTKAPLKIFQLAFRVKKEGTNVEIPVREDKEPPETFKPEIASDPDLFEGKWFIVFAAQDKYSGIDHYEILETKSKILGVLSKIQEIEILCSRFPVYCSWFPKWISADSPYVLKDQKLQSYILIKAIDKNSNKRIVKINPKNPLFWYEQYKILSIIIGAGIIVYLLIRVLWKKYAEK